MAQCAWNTRSKKNFVSTPAGAPVVWNRDVTRALSFFGEQWSHTKISKPANPSSARRAENQSHHMYKMIPEPLASEILREIRKALEATGGSELRVFSLLSCRTRQVGCARP